VAGEQGVPQLRQVVLDATDARVLAEFYRRLLGYRYRPGDEPPAPGEPDPQGQDWLVLRAPAGGQQVASSRWRRCRGRPGRRARCPSSCTWT
jgi:hypothetical protein